MINVLVHDPGSGQTRSGDSALLDAWDPAGASMLWLDLDCHDTVAARELLTARLGISPLAASDALRERHPPKLEWFDDYFFLLFKAFTAETEDGVIMGVRHRSHDRSTQLLGR